MVGLAVTGTHITGMTLASPLGGAGLTITLAYDGALTFDGGSAITSSFDDELDGGTAGSTYTDTVNGGGS